MDQNSPWGIVAHSPQEWDFNELSSGGVAWVRLDFPWKDIQKTSPDVAGGGAFNWAYFDAAVNWATSRGMHILGGLGATPAWAVDPVRYQQDTRWIKYKHEAYPPKNLQHWDNFVNAVVTRYGTRVRHWGIWNEPDSYSEPVNVCFWRGSMQEFFTSILGRAINVIGTRGAICAADFAKANAVVVPWREHWIRDMLRNYGRRLRAVNIHVYRGTGDGSDVIDGARTARGLVDSYNAANGTRIELWITETGWHKGQHSEAEIGRRLQDLCDNVRANPWVKKIFPYVWSENFADSANFKRAPNTPGQQWTSYKAGIRGA